MRCLQVDGIVNEFQANWSAFERLHSDTYINQLKVKTFCGVVSNTFSRMNNSPWGQALLTQLSFVHGMT